MRIVADQFLHCSWSVVDNLQKERSACAGHAAESADNRVVDEARDLVGCDGLRAVGIEHFQKMPEVLAFRLLAERLILVQSVAVQCRIVVERDTVQTEICAPMPFCRLAVEVAALN